MKKSRTKLLILEVAALIFIVAIKVYLIYFESDYYSANAVAIKKIDKSKADFSFAVFGNIKNSLDVFPKIIKDINTGKMEFAVSLGNAVFDGTEDKYRALYKIARRLTVPIVFILGERDVSEEGRMLFYKHFGPFYFSFFTRSAAFIFLDSTDERNMLWQKMWLIGELKRAAKYKYRFVFMNKPLHRLKGLKSAPDEEYCLKNSALADFLTKIFQKYKVTAVFSSNVEVFNRQNFGGVEYLTTGGAGGSLYLNNRASFYHYVKVSVRKNKVIYEVKKIKPTFGFLRKMFINVWFYIHSLFYVKVWDYLLWVLAILIASTAIYIMATEKVDYYRNFDSSVIKTPADMKLNIAMFTNNYYPFVGGVPVSVERLAEGLRKLGHTVYVFAPQYPEKDSRDGQFVIRCPALHYYTKSGFAVPIANIYDPEIEKKFKNLRINVVHAHHPYWMGTKALKLSKKYNIPLTYTYHTRLEKYAHNIPLFGKLFENKIPHYIIKNFAQKCDAVFAPTATAKEYLRNIGVSRHIEIMPSGVDFKYYENVSDADLRHLALKYGISDEVVLFSASRLSKEKNIDFLLGGIKLIKSRSPRKLKCLIAGDGPEKERLEKYIKSERLNDAVLLIGSLDAAEMAKHYIFADVFVFASLSETQGMVLLEAMAGRCPVVAVRSSGIEDAVVDGKNGYKTAENIEEWAEKVMKLILDDSLRKKMAQNASAFAKKFSLEEIARQAEQTYKFIMAKKRSV